MIKKTAQVELTHQISGHCVVQFWQIFSLRCLNWTFSNAERVPCTLLRIFVCGSLCALLACLCFSSEILEIVQQGLQGRHTSMPDLKQNVCWRDAELNRNKLLVPWYPVFYLAMPRWNVDVMLQMIATLLSRYVHWTLPSECRAPYIPIDNSCTSSSAAHWRSLTWFLGDVLYEKKLPARFCLFMMM